MAKAKRRAGRTAKKSSYVATATDASTPVAKRVDAIRRAAPQLATSEANFDRVVKVLQQVDEQPEVRLAALQSLQAASFRVVVFEPLRSAYIAVLRALAKDPQPELRQRALGILAREKDRPTQKRLLAGLENPEQALVPPQKALQFLSYDVHTDAYAVARKIVKHPPNEPAKRQSLRLLAADASAAPLFEQLLRDKTESPEVRQVCAAALQAVKPKKYQEHARQMAIDPDEDEDLRTQSLVALTNFGDAKVLSEDKVLQTGVEALKDATPKLKKSARQFLKKYGE